MSFQYAADNIFPFFFNEIKIQFYNLNKYELQHMFYDWYTFINTYNLNGEYYVYFAIHLLFIYKFFEKLILCIFLIFLICTSIHTDRFSTVSTLIKVREKELSSANIMLLTGEDVITSMGYPFFYPSGQIYKWIVQFESSNYVKIIFTNISLNTYEVQISFMFTDNLVFFFFCLTQSTLSSAANLTLTSTCTLFHTNKVRISFLYPLQWIQC